MNGAYGIEHVVGCPRVGRTLLQLSAAGSPEYICPDCGQWVGEDGPGVGPHRIVAEAVVRQFEIDEMVEALSAEKARREAARAAARR